MIFSLGYTEEDQYLEPSVSDESHNKGMEPVLGGYKRRFPNPSGREQAGAITGQFASSSLEAKEEGEEEEETNTRH